MSLQLMKIPMERTSLGLHAPEDESPTLLQNFYIFQLRYLKINKKQVTEKWFNETYLLIVSSLTYIFGCVHILAESSY